MEKRGVQPIILLSSGLVLPNQAEVTGKGIWLLPQDPKELQLSLINGYQLLDIFCFYSQLVSAPIQASGSQPFLHWASFLV